MGFWLGTLIFALLELLGFGIVQASGARHGNKLLKHTLVGTTVACCWMMWGIVYIAQLHPLMRPTLQG
ncbi:hypothetical protein ACKKBG_A02185 [Auxenochlorella protothecoides x Auxenochlorella symbiontica]|uniref:V-type proton ATPase subunit e n=1 Tax=Auxenochlorella protothecoides TaxID=3075 RepID=A0A087SAP6_AUXPR|nr:hypothetical protein F751_2991 [Auxenochlorella protothecoides]KFM22800.1 hypothetical protein F751_2991 [Auxenochlorella protothecoides]RMZ52129.1 hypothetical protein APUTEX25_001519 [Auxenochlorella protothecoides]|eukprot:RMZ52129.1 hypothetical protein APUTEX25_001519 [Auxenochlorella protothecoides]